MKNFVIIANPGKEGSFEKSRSIMELLKSRGCTCTAALMSEESSGKPYLYTDPALVPKGTEAVLSLGGDGTMIHAAKDLLPLNLPVFGINFGTLGYLTESSADDFGVALDEIVAGNYEIEERMLLEADICKEGKVTGTGLALNDIVINRSLATGIAQLDVEIDGHFLNSYSADGMIISTPTGSTGYNLSAGGPVVLPTGELVLITPICAHTLNSRSVVLPGDIEIRVTCHRNQVSYVTIDGEKGIELSQGDSIVARKADRSVKIIKINRSSFIENLGKKMR